MTLNQRKQNRARAYRRMVRACFWWHDYEGVLIADYAPETGRPWFRVLDDHGLPVIEEFELKAEVIRAGDTTGDQLLDIGPTEYHAIQTREGTLSFWIEGLRVAPDGRLQSPSKTSKPSNHETDNEP